MEDLRNRLKGEDVPYATTHRCRLDSREVSEMFVRIQHKRLDKKVDHLSHSDNVGGKDEMTVARCKRRGAAVEALRVRQAARLLTVEIGAMSSLWDVRFVTVASEQHPIPKLPQA